MSNVLLKQKIPANIAHHLTQTVVEKNDLGLITLLLQNSDVTLKYIAELRNEKADLEVFIADFKNSCFTGFVPDEREMDPHLSVLF